MSFTHLHLVMMDIINLCSFVGQYTCTHDIQALPLFSVGFFTWGMLLLEGNSSTGGGGAITFFMLNQSHGL